jgi:regulator of sigma E protease
MGFLITLIIFILIIGFLVFIHELGHFLAAKICKIPVKEFAIGFGPVLISKKYKETHYRLRALPLGGFVSLEGERTNSSPMGFRNRSFGVKFFVLVAGIVMNLIAAVILFGIFLGANNRVFVVPKLADYSFHNVEKEYEYFPMQVFNIDEEYGWSGIEDDEIIVEIDNKKVLTYGEFEDFIDNNIGGEVDVSVISLETLDIQEKTITVGGYGKYDAIAVEIVEIPEDSPSFNQLYEGEKIIGINGQFFNDRDDFLNLVDGVSGEEVTFNLINLDGDREDRLVEVGERRDDGSILGLIFRYDAGIDYVPVTFSDRLTYFVQYKNNLLSPFSFTYDAALYQILGLGNIISESFETGDFEEVSQSVGGPIAVANLVDDVVDLGIFESLVPLTAFISLSLAIFNILPIPALDGGQIAIAFVEKMRGKLIRDEIVEKINLVGFAFLIIFSILIFVKDINQFNVIEGLFEFFGNIIGK